MTMLQVIIDSLDQQKSHGSRRDGPVVADTGPCLFPRQFEDGPSSNYSGRPLLRMQLDLTRFVAYEEANFRSLAFGKQIKPLGRGEFAKSASPLSRPQLLN